MNIKEILEKHRKWLAETIRPFRAETVPYLRLKVDPSTALRLVQGRIKLVCPECGTVSDLAWSTWLECDGPEDPRVDAVREMYLNRSRARWNRMRRAKWRRRNE